MSHFQITLLHIHYHLLLSRSLSLGSVAHATATLSISDVHLFPHRLLIYFSTFSLPCLASSLKNILRKLLHLFVTHCSIPLSRRRASPQKHPPLLSDEHRGCQKWTGPWHCRPSLTDLILRSSFFNGCPFAQPVQVGSFHHRPLTLSSQSRAEHVFGSLRPLAVTVANGVVASLDQLNSGDGEALHLDLLQFIG